MNPEKSFDLVNFYLNLSRNKFILNDAVLSKCNANFNLN